MDSFFSNENAIIDAVNEINDRDEHHEWSYEIISDTKLNLDWSYLGVSFSVEMSEDGSLIVRNERGDIINGSLDYDDDIYDTIISVFEYALAVVV